MRRRYAPYQESHATFSAPSNANNVCDFLCKPMCQPRPHLGKQNKEPALHHAQNQNETGDPPENQPPGWSGKTREDLTFQLTDTSVGARDDAQMTEGLDPSSQSGMIASHNQSSVSPVSGNQSYVEPNPSNRFSELGDGDGSSKGIVHNSNSPNAALGYGLATDDLFNKDSSGRSDHRRMVSSESGSRQSEKEDFQDVFSEIMTSTEHEVAFLTRHYVQTIGPWYASY